MEVLIPEGPMPPRTLNCAVKMTCHFGRSMVKFTKFSTKTGDLQIVPCPCREISNSDCICHCHLFCQLWIKPLEPFKGAQRKRALPGSLPAARTTSRSFLWLTAARQGRFQPHSKKESPVGLGDGLEEDWGGWGVWGVGGGESFSGSRNMNQ